LEKAKRVSDKLKNVLINERSRVEKFYQVKKKQYLDMDEQYKEEQLTMLKSTKRLREKYVNLVNSTETYLNNCEANRNKKFKPLQLFNDFYQGKKHNKIAIKKITSCSKNFKRSENYYEVLFDQMKNYNSDFGLSAKRPEMKNKMKSFKAKKAKDKVHHEVFKEIYKFEKQTELSKKRKAAVPKMSDDDFFIQSEKIENEELLKTELKNENDKIMLKNKKLDEEIKQFEIDAKRIRDALPSVTVSIDKEVKERIDLLTEYDWPDFRENSIIKKFVFAKNKYFTQFDFNTMIKKANLTRFDLDDLDNYMNSRRQDLLLAKNLNCIDKVSLLSERGAIVYCNFINGSKKYSKLSDRINKYENQDETVTHKLSKLLARSVLEGSNLQSNGLLRGKYEVYGSLLKQLKLKTNIERLSKMAQKYNLSWLKI